MLRRLALVMSVVALGLSPLIACGAETISARDSDVDEAGSEGAAPDAPADTSFPVLPYPPGPYGIGNGDVMPDITIQGYRLSRTQRDSRKLPFENIRLSEVRSDPACQCMALVYNVAGTGCSFCVDMSSTVASIVARDPTICAAEVIAFSYDALDPDGGNNPPPTRADLDAVVQATRTPYPVGLATNGLRPLGFQVIPGIPDLFVMHTSDMKIRAFTVGSGDVEQRIRDHCAKPWPPVETIATGLTAPRRMVHDFTYAYLSDGGRMVRVPLAGGAPVVLVEPSSTPDAIAIDSTHVYWATHEGGVQFEIGRVSKSGGPSESLTTGAVGYLSVSVDSTNVWFLRADGTIASVPLTGGPETPFTNEPGASSLVADATTLYWIANKEVVSQPKIGGTRKVLATPADLKSFFFSSSEPVELALGPNELFVKGTTTQVAMTITRISKVAGTRLTFNGAPIGALGVAPNGEGFYAAFDPLVGMSAINHFVHDQSKGDRRGVLTLGQHTVTAIAHDNTYAYWTDATDAGVVLRRIGPP